MEITLLATTRAQAAEDLPEGVNSIRKHQAHSSFCLDSSVKV